MERPNNKYFSLMIYMRVKMAKLQNADYVDSFFQFCIDRYLCNGNRIHNMSWLIWIQCTSLKISEKASNVIVCKYQNLKTNKKIYFYSFMLSIGINNSLTQLLRYQIFVGFLPLMYIATNAWNGGLVFSVTN